MTSIEQMHSLTPEELYATNAGLVGEDYVNALAQLAASESAE